MTTTTTGLIQQTPPELLREIALNIKLVLADCSLHNLKLDLKELALERTNRLYNEPIYKLRSNKRGRQMANASTADEIDDTQNNAKFDLPEFTDPDLKEKAFVVVIRVRDCLLLVRMGRGCDSDYECSVFFHGLFVVSSAGGTLLVPDLPVDCGVWGGDCRCQRGVEHVDWGPQAKAFVGSI